MEKKLNYMLILSWFHSLNFNLFETMIYDINDLLKFILQEENEITTQRIGWNLFYKKMRLLMIEEWDEGAQSNKEAP